MAQHDYIIDNASGAVFRSDLNDAMKAIATNNSGTSAPTTTYPYMWWPDVTNSRLKQRNGANTAWIDQGPLDTAGFGHLVATNNLSDIASASSARGNLGLGSAATKNTGSSGDAVPLCNTATTWGGQQTPLVAALTDASTVAWNCATAQVATLTTAAARIIGSPTNAVTGTSYRLVLTTGGYTPSAWNSVFDFMDFGTPSSLSGTCIFDFFYDGTKFRLIGAHTGGA